MNEKVTLQKQSMKKKQKKSFVFLGSSFVITMAIVIQTMAYCVKQKSKELTLRCRKMRLEVVIFKNFPARGLSGGVPPHPPVTA